MAFARVEGSVGGHASDLLVWRDLVEKQGSMGAPPTSLEVNSATRNSNDCSSITIWILRQTRRCVPPCLRALYSHSSSTLIPVLPISACTDQRS